MPGTTKGFATRGVTVANHLWRGQVMCEAGEYQIYILSFHLFTGFLNADVDSLHRHVVPLRQDTQRFPATGAYIFGQFTKFIEQL